MSKSRKGAKRSRIHTGHEKSEKLKNLKNRSLVKVHGKSHEDFKKNWLKSWKCSWKKKSTISAVF